MTVEHFDAVVVGSGFGGSISALRLAQAERRVLVLERGRAYSPAAFPRDVSRVDEIFWRHRERPDAQGLFELHAFSGAATVTASGVGGGSLIYANIHIRPHPVVFDDPRWPLGTDRHALDPYYDKVAAALRVAPVPESVTLPKRDVFRAAAASIGARVFDPDQAVAWTGDPGAGRESCRMCTECEFGCRYGAKNTLDFTYLADAAALGAELRDRCLVERIAPSDDGYEVHYRSLASGGAPRTVSCRRLVLAAGTLGTNRLLLRARDLDRTLPALSARLGAGYSGNGDFLGTIQRTRDDLEPWNGPDVTSVMSFFDREPRFTLAAPTFNRPVSSVLASFGQSSGWPLRPFGGGLWKGMQRSVPWMFSTGWLDRPIPIPLPGAGPPERFTNVFAIGQDNANGRMRLRDGELDIEWDYARENQALVERMEDTLRAVASAYGGRYAPLVSWSVSKRIVTVHSLGGCHMATSPEHGVVSTEGEVFGYPGLFVADGSVVPTSIGFHPVMTISALAERTAEAVAHSY